MRRHINSIPRVESHYIRADSSREYFEGSLDLSTLYRMYVEKCNSEKEAVAKKHVYETIFNTEFNTGFHKHKKDQCVLCEEYKNSSEEEKQILKDRYRGHLTEKQMLRQEKENDIHQATEEKNGVVAVYDFQAVTPLPCGEISSFYYKRKSNLYNFTIYEAVPKEGNCFMWHEGEGGRGANEVGSCVMELLKSCENGK